MKQIILFIILLSATFTHAQSGGLYTYMGCFTNETDDYTYVISQYHSIGTPAIGQYTLPENIDLAIPDGQLVAAKGVVTQQPEGSFFYPQVVTPINFVTAEINNENYRLYASGLSYDITLLINNPFDRLLELSIQSGTSGEPQYITIDPSSSVMLIQNIESFEPGAVEIEINTAQPTSEDTVEISIKKQIFISPALLASTNTQQQGQ